MKFKLSRIRQYQLPRVVIMKSHKKYYYFDCNCNIYAQMLKYKVKMKLWQGSENY